MKLEPCREDLAAILASWAVLLICCAGLAFLLAWAPAAIWVSLMLAIVCSLDLLRDAVYFARTVTLDQTGCAFSLFRFQRTYAWADLEVRRCDGRGIKFHDADPGGAGILIYPRTARYSGRLAPMTWCRRCHPVSSVFLRFPDGRHIPAHIYRGYSADREALQALLRSAGL